MGLHYKSMLGVLLLLPTICLGQVLYKYSGIHYPYPFQDPSLPWEQRVDDLVGRLTLEEIAAQTLAIYGQATPAIPRLGMKPYVWITECIRGQASTNGTAFPQSLGLAASFSTELISEMATAVATEVRAHWNGNTAKGIYASMNGLSCFSPVINIMRHPLWGRNQETYGEDPFLSGSLVQSYVRGLQGNHPRYVRANAGCKHFDVHGGPENIPASRFSFNAKVSTRDWRMTFLPQFKMCVEAGTYSLMCSYNSINGVPACADGGLLTNITRKEWGFTGYVVSDAGAIGNIISQHHYLKTKADTAAAAISAGCNLELGSSVFLAQLEALEKGQLTQKQIRDNVKPLFYTRFRLGEFDPVQMNPYNAIPMSVVQSVAHRQLALRAALKTFVLLKNDGKVLPVGKKYAKLAIVGPFAQTRDQLFGDYAPTVTSRFTTTVCEGLRGAGLAAATACAPGCDTPACGDYHPGDVLQAAAGADLVVVALGTGQALEAEGRDRSDLGLAGHQLQILKDATDAAPGAHVVLLLFNAGPLDVTWAKLSPRVHAIVACTFPAQSTGVALARMFSGVTPDDRPAGRLAATWPANLNQIPPMTDYTMKGRTYRYYDGDPLYPFGYGLSYTLFKYSGLKCTPSQIAPGQDVQVSVKVQNVGKLTSDEVTQVYMSWGNHTVPGLPRWQLVGFQRNQIVESMTTTVTITIKAEQMAVWADDVTGWTIPTGTMTVYAGGQQPNQRTDVGSNVVTSGFIIA